MLLQNKYQVFRNPVFHLVIKDFFPKAINKSILKEAINNKDNFTPGTIGKGFDLVYRSNVVAYYDQIYQYDRSKSFLLSALDGKFQSDSEFRQILATCPMPISDFMMTTTHESQVSRYGNEQHYDWHQDRFADIRRHITLVYYFFEEPKQWTGGDLLFTDSPGFETSLVEKNPNIKRITPENNMAIVFSSAALHRVESTKSPKEFGKGRFSANIWIGFV